MVYTPSKNNSGAASVWEKKFCMMPRRSSTSGKLIWLQYGFRRKKITWFPSGKNGVAVKYLFIWLTPHEHLLELLRSNTVNNPDENQSYTGYVGH